MTLPKIPIGVGFPLYKGVEYINDAIEAADKAQQDSASAKTSSENAVSTANAAETKADSVQEQFNQVVIKGDSSVEAAQARVDAEGNSFTTLKERLDNGDALLAENTSTDRHEVLNKSFQERKSFGVSSEEILKPIWFTWEAPINIYKKDGLFLTDFDVSEFEPTNTGNTFYVDPVNGSDSNNGLSLVTALKSVYAAINKGNVGLVLIASGTVKRTELPATIPNRDLSIKALPGADVTFSCHDDLTWSLVSGMSKTYQTTRSATDWVWDSKKADENGDNEKLVLRSSIAEVESNPGSYFINGSTVYVHTFDSRNLIGDKDIRVYLGTISLEHIGDKTLYFENIKFEGGRWRVYNSSTGLDPLVLAKGCSWKYMAGNQPGGFELIGGDAYLQNCVAAKNMADGFNYHIGNGRTNRVIEVDCVGRDNGNRTTPINSDNGSTMHDGGQIIRINGAYYRNEGPNVADVNNGTQSWNLGCIGLESRSTVNSADFRARDNMMMRLDGCITNEPSSIESADGATIETNDVVTNAVITSNYPLEVDIPSLVTGVVRTLNKSIMSVSKEIPILKENISSLESKTVHSSGVNANGQWIRFQDGTQIAVTSLILLNGETFVADGALYRSSNSFTVPFPNSFVGASYQVTVVPRRLGGSGTDNRVWVTMYTQDSFMLYKTNGTSLTDCGYVATIIGRWK